MKFKLKKSGKKGGKHASPEKVQVREEQPPAYTTASSNMPYYQSQRIVVGEVQPLMMTGEEGNFEQGTRRRGSCRTFVCALSGSLILLALFSTLYVTLSKGAQSIHDQSKKAHKQDVRTEDTYSKNADYNLQTLLNTQPTTNTNVGCQGTVLLMPHCESSFKTDTGPGENRDNCNFKGMQRAFYLITQFGIEKRWPIPHDIYVFGSTFRRNRAIETMLPLQRYYNIQGRMDPSTYDNRAQLVQRIGSLITSGELCSRVITVTTAFTVDIPDIASDLGCGPSNAGAGCPMIYDRNDVDSVWELRFVYDKNGNERVNDKINSVDDTNTTENSDADKLKWRIYGNVVKERFDPLAFSKLVGDYDPGAPVQEEPRWMNMTIYKDLP
mmetsp:Transcript_25013/g.37038  ORF Transcript_25013/g.37038 Transcript_25013/m.37038 type:complete len:382 (-) Transcript_25013:1722-2867(-)